MKYIVIKDCQYTLREKIFLFPDAEMHSDFYSTIKNADMVLVSGGFVKMVDDGVYCTGESISLRVRSRKEDTDLLRKEILNPY